MILTRRKLPDRCDQVRMERRGLVTIRGAGKRPVMLGACPTIVQLFSWHLTTNLSFIMEALMLEFQKEVML